MSETLEVFGKTYTNVTGIKASTPTGDIRAFTIGTDDYEELKNQPSINNVTLVGNKTAAQLGLATPSDIPTVPVQSVNSKTGAVVLSASDVGALPSNTAIPSKTSDLTNDSGFVNASGAAAAAPVQSVNSKTGAVVLTASDVGAGTYSKPSGGIPKSDLTSAVQTSLGKADTALQTAPVTSVNSKTGAVSLTASDVGAYVLPANGIPDSDIASAATWNAKGTYSKPSGGIPKTDLASAVQTSLGKADTALQSAPVTSVNTKTGAVVLTASDVGAGTYSKPSGGIPKTDLASAVQTSLGKADTALQSHQSLAAYRTSADQDTIDATKITKPASPVSGQSLMFDGTDWISKANLFIVGGTVSSTSLTISDSRITANSYLVSILSMDIDIGSQLLYWTTTNGTITFNGTFSSPTTIYVIMADI